MDRGKIDLKMQNGSRCLNDLRGRPPAITKDVKRCGGDEYNLLAFGLKNDKKMIDCSL